MRLIIKFLCLALIFVFIILPIWLWGECLKGYEWATENEK